MQTLPRSTRSLPLATALIYCALFFLVEHSRWYPLTFSNPAWGTSATLGAISGGGITRPAAYVAIGLSGFYFLARRKRPDFVVKGAPLFLVTCYLAWSWLSCLWADDLQIVFKRVIAFTLLLFAAYALSRSVRRSDLPLIIWTSTAAFLGMGFISEWKLGTLSFSPSDYRFMGTLTPEAQAFNCGMLFLSSVTLADKSTSLPRLFFRIASIVAFCFLLFTKSRGPFGAVIFAFLVYLCLARRRFAFTQFLYLIFTAVLVFVLLYGASGFVGVMLLGRREKVSSLTGRIPLWIECLTFVENRPVTGYGFGGFWTTGRATDFTKEIGWVINSSHSIYLEIALNTGLVGLGLLLSIFLVSWTAGWRSARSDPDAVTAFLVSILAACCADGLLSTLVTLNGFVTFVMFTVVFYLCFSLNNSGSRGRAGIPVPVPTMTLSGGLPRAAVLPESGGR